MCSRIIQVFFAHSFVKCEIANNLFDSVHFGIRVGNIYIGRSRFWLCTLYVFIEIYLFCLCFVSMQNFLVWWFFLLFFSSSKQKSVERTRCLFQTSNFGCTKAKSWEKEKKAHRKREWKREKTENLLPRTNVHKNKPATSDQVRKI